MQTIRIPSLPVTFGVPLLKLEIDLPAIRGFGETKLKISARKPVGLFGFTCEPHTRLLGSSAPFALIAGLTSRNNILPALAASLNDGDNMIQGELILAKVMAAVLAAVRVSQEDVHAREADDLALLDRNIGQESQDGGNLDRNSNGADFLFRILDHLDLALKEQLEGALPGDDMDGFERSVEHECVTHYSIIRLKCSPLQLGERAKSLF